MRTKLMSAWRTLAAVVVVSTCGLNGSLAQPSDQQNATCPTTSGDIVYLNVNDSSSLDELYSSLDGAESCDIKPSISVDWGGTVEVSRTITVPRGIELRIRGEGYAYYGNNMITMNGASSTSGDDISTSGTTSDVIRGNGSVRLFFVNETGSLFMSGMTLQSGWGGDNGGGGIHALGETTVISDNCSWESLSANGSGGAISAIGAANLTLRGTNIFSKCSSLSRGGGIYLDNSSLSTQGGLRFETCTARRKGGGMHIKNTSQLKVAEGALVSFSGCTAGSEGGDNGGGLCSYDSSITVGANAKVSFENNAVPADGDGGGLYAKNVYITVGKGANLSFVNNHAEDDGGGMFLEGNSDDYNGEEDMIACFTLAEGADAQFFGNSAGAGFGGGLEVSTGCDVMIAGDVHFEQNFGVRAGAMYMDTAKAVISGRATFVNNTAERWGGAVMVIDSDNGLELNGPVNFQNNSAGRSGGAVYLENTCLVVTGGNDSHENVGVLWEGNSAGYDGGAIAIDGSEVSLQGGFARSNHASQRGGVLFSTGDSSLSWTAGESWCNSAASGGSLYISNSEVNITDVHLAEDHTPSGGVMFFASANARVVKTSIIAPPKLVGDFALHVDDDSVVRLFSCSFEMWGGDNSLIVSEGQLVMDACDFSQSSNTILLSASQKATIRNAILGDKNYVSTGYNTDTIFGSGVNTCSTLSEAYFCLSNKQEMGCVDADYGMGVLCAEYIAAATGEKVSLSRSNSSVELISNFVPASSTSWSPGSSAFYYPDLVEEELTLRYSSASSSESGSSSKGESTSEMATEAVLWELRSFSGSNGGLPSDNGVFCNLSRDNFSWVAMPASGVLVKGQKITISLVGSPPPVRDPQRPSAVYNGNISAGFRVLSRTAEAGSTTNSSLEYIRAAFYYCQIGDYWDGEECVSCVELMSNMADGEGSLDCFMPGVTLETLPLAEGYWRGDVNRTIVKPCLLAEACKGGRGKLTWTDSISTEKYLEDTRYCAAGYRGPYCAVCADGYRRLSGYECLDCQSEWGAAAYAVLWLAVALTPVLLVSLMLYLFGGATSFKQLRRKVYRMCGHSKPAGVTHWPVEEDLETKSAAEEEDDGKEGGPSRHLARARGAGARVLRAIPFQQLKILIVVWQILTEFSDMAEIPYPSSYKRFLGTLDVFDFDPSWPLSAMCLVEEINFYEKLVIVTVGPIVILSALGLSYRGAMWWHRGTNRSATESRQQAKVRHASAALLVLFLIFSSVSTTIFSTFSCDYVEDLEVRLLRADYSISCDDRGHLFYQVYAGAMILVYPVGIPVLFAYLLIMRRDKINPPVAVEAGKPTLGVRAPPLSSSQDHHRALSEITEMDISTTSHIIYEDEVATVGRVGTAVEYTETSKRLGSSSGDGSSRGDSVCSIAGTQRMLDCMHTPTAIAHRKEVLNRRAQDLDLQPTKFLWEPYEPHNFYFESLECGRRCLLTGALVFVLPNTAGQMAGACIFAFLTLLAFELIRPHLSRNDAWMYRTGCIVIFFSNFLGLMAKADVSGEEAQSQQIFSILLIFVHAVMVMAIIFQGYLTLQHELDENRSSDENDGIDGRLEKSGCKESTTKRGSFDSGFGSKRDAAIATRSPQRRSASRSIYFGAEDRFRVLASATQELTQPGRRSQLQRDDDPGFHDRLNIEGRSTVTSRRPVHQTELLTRPWLAREAVKVHSLKGAPTGQVTGVAGSISPTIGNLDGMDEEPEFDIAFSGKNPLFASARSSRRSPSPSARIIRGGSVGCGAELAQGDFSLPLEGPMFNRRNTASPLGNGRSGRIGLIKTASSRPGPSQLASPI